MTAGPATVPYESVGVAVPPSERARQRRIFFASFMTLVVAGIGFGVRNGILGDWSGQFGFTKTDLGFITGAGLLGFPLTIVIGSYFADRLGYRLILMAAFAMHVVSAVVTVAGTPVFHAFGKTPTYWCLYAGTFTFALANGLCEAAINPLTATLYPRNKTHYLNILHAGWPAGLILGGAIAYLFVGSDAKLAQLRWEVLILMYLVPALYYGAIIFTHRFPVSEAKAAGVSVGQQLAVLLAPLLIFLFLIHAMIGYVELGTDSWIQNIMHNVIGNNASLLLVYISALMFALRFFAGPIVHRINPLGLLFVSACLGAIGLYMLGSATTGLLIAVAGTIFAIGKTFYWPTMLGVIGERFPRGGALAMGVSGAFGALSAGLLGSPGIGYTQDYYASKQLQSESIQTYDRVKSEELNGFLFFPAIRGLDGAKVKIVTDAPPGKTLAEDVAFAAKVGKHEEKLETLNSWFQNVERPHVDADKPLVASATDYGGRMGLKVTVIVPITMAVCYLLLVFYFISRGGYRAIHLDVSGREVEVSHDATPNESMVGGVPAPVES
jgi:MFS family permease